MTLLCEVAGAPEEQAAPELADRIAQSIREATKLRAEVRLVPPSSLPNDGKVIEDTRKLD